MNEATLKFLDDLSNRLSTTGQALWASFVHGVFISGIVDLVWVVGTIAVGLITAHYLKRLVNSDRWEEWDDAQLGVIIGAAFLYAFLAISGSICLYSGISEVANPEYVALQQLLSAGALKK